MSDTVLKTYSAIIVPAGMVADRLRYTEDVTKLPPAVEFLKKTLKVKEGKVVKATKASLGWEIEAEVYEESSFMKSLGLATKVQDRNIYVVKLSDGLEVESYERQGHPVLTD